MQYTNRFGLPEEITSVLAKDRYNPDNEDIGDYSATKLIAPIQQTILSKRYKDKLKIFDYIDLFYSFTGSIAHAVLQEHAADNSLVEKRFYAKCLGKTISGQVDLYKDSVITDFKTTRCFKLMKSDFTEWEIQTNIYRFLAEANSYPVTKLRVFAFLLDWTQANNYQKNYPECPIVEIPLRLWEPKEIEAYIENRVNALNVASGLIDKDLDYYYPCSEKEMWQDVRDWALLKKDKPEGRALKVFKTQEEANSWTAKKDEIILPRKSARTRCHRYCAAAPICLQHKRLCAEEGSPIDETPTIF
jgi:hypothetical protein